MTILKKLARFFDRLEDTIRARLSHRPILYALIGGIGIVLFWKGVWEAAEQFPALSGVPSALLGLLLILPTGLFVSFFIGDNIILSGYKREKKIAERTESELRAEIDAIKNMSLRIEHIEKGVKHIQQSIERESLRRDKGIPESPEQGIDSIT